MKIKPSLIRYKVHTYTFFLVIISFSTNQYYAYSGVLPVDSFSTFNAGYDILNGSLPFKDFWTIKGPVLDVLQALYFKIFGVSWFSYSLHSSSFNSIFALATFYTLNNFDLDLKYSFIYSALSSILMYPYIWNTIYRSSRFYIFNISDLLSMYRYKNKSKHILVLYTYFFIPWFFYKTNPRSLLRDTHCNNFYFILIKKF